MDNGFLNIFICANSIITKYDIVATYFYVYPIFKSLEVIIIWQTK